MNDADISPLAAEFPQPPNHLREALGLAAREELEFATDGVWPDGSEGTPPGRRALRRRSTRSGT